MIESRWLVLSVCILVALTGCAGPFQATETPEPRQDAIYDGHVFLEHTEHDDNDSSYYASGHVYYDASTNSFNTTFEDVMLCLYDSEGNVLNATSVGSLNRANQSVEYVISATERPAYEVVDHPKFHQDDRMYPTVHVWNGERYEIRSVSLGEVQDDFEYPRHNETGRCL